MMLLDPNFIWISCRQILLQVALDVMRRAKSVEKIEHTNRIIFPIRCFGHRKIIDAADFVQVNERVSGAHDSEAGFDIKRRFQAYPCVDACVVEGFERSHPVLWKGCTRLPFGRKPVIEASHGAGERVTVWTEQVKITKRAGAALGERANAKAVILKTLDGVSRQRRVARMVWVCREGKHNLFGDARFLVLPRIARKVGKEIRARESARIEFRSILLCHSRNVAIGAAMAASTIRIARKRRIFARLAAGWVNVRTAFWVHRLAPL